MLQPSCFLAVWLASLLAGVVAETDVDGLVFYGMMPS